LRVRISIIFLSKTAAAMAYLLYKCIRKQARESEAKKANPDGFENLGEDQHSPVPAGIAGLEDINITQRSETPMRQNGTQEKSYPAPETVATSTKTKEVTQTPEEKKAMRIYRAKLIGGLFFPFSVQALETTIIAAALPYIASDFSKQLFS
jgi:hypothetical protein